VCACVRVAVSNSNLKQAVKTLERQQQVKDAKYRYPENSEEVMRLCIVPFGKQTAAGKVIFHHLLIL